MQARSPRPADDKRMLGRIAHDPVVLWAAFAVVHVVLVLINLVGSGYPLGDVTSVYKFWTDQAIIADYWVGIDAPWVYPIVAILPMLAAQFGYPIAESIPALSALAAGPTLYASTWLILMVTLDAIAFGILTGWGRRRDRYGAAWWWIGFLLALGPITLGRIDTVTVTIAIVGAVLIAARPRLASVLLTVGAWIKVWPGVIVIAMVVATKARWRVLGAAVATSVAITVLALAFGSGVNVFSWVGQQAGRGLQVEAPVTTAWMWRAWAGAPGATVYFDPHILTWQVTGAGVSITSALMTPLLVLVVAAIALLGIVAVKRGASPSAILPPLVLALLVGIIAFQKVGSPQFISWLAVPVILGIVSHRENRAASFRMPAILVLALAALTHVIYPYLYGYLLGLFPAMLTVLTIRNALLFVLLGWALMALVRSARWTPAPSSDKLDVLTRSATTCRSGNTMLVAFSIAPSGGAGGDSADSVHDAVAAAVRVVRASGLPNHTDSMFTTIEGDWDEVFDVIRRATDAVAEYGTRVSLVLKADIRPGRTGELTGKVDRLERAIAEQTGTEQTGTEQTGQSDLQ